MRVNTERFLSGMFAAAVTPVAAAVIGMASHGRSGLSTLIMGSVTQKVLTHSRMPVLVYR